MHLLMTREELENKMAVLLGGRAAANATPSMSDAPNASTAARW